MHDDEARQPSLQEPGIARTTDVDDRPARRTTGRVAAVGLAVVLFLLTGFGLWVAFATDRAAYRLEQSSRLSNDYESARYAVASEESLERKYRLEPGPDVRVLFDRASASLQAALSDVRSKGAAADRALVDRVLSLHVQYLTAIGRMFDAVDASKPARVLSIDHRSVDPAFSIIEREVDAQAAAHQGEALDRLRDLGRSSHLIFVATPITFAVGLGLLAVFIVLLVGFRRRIEEARRREQSRAVEEQRRLLQGTVRSAEEERSRIAAELHDGPIQHLAALDYRLETISNRLATRSFDPALEQIRRVQEWLRQDISALRHTMAELRLPVVDRQGLSAALQAHARGLTEGTPTECTVDFRLDGNLDPTIETILYRVTQEALRNVVKHANAPHATVALDDRNGPIRLEVVDDGRGFVLAPAEVLIQEGHFGLVGIRERVEMAGGTFRLESEPGAGTRLSVELPRAGVTS